MVIDIHLTWKHILALLFSFFASLIFVLTFFYWNLLESSDHWGNTAGFLFMVGYGYYLWSQGEQELEEREKI